MIWTKKNEKKKMGTAHIIKLFPLKEKTKGTQNLNRRKKLQVCTETSISEFAQQNKKYILYKLIM